MEDDRSSTPAAARSYRGRKNELDAAIMDGAL